jgi:hypothetical protein
MRVKRYNIEAWTGISAWPEMLIRHFEERIASSGLSVRLSIGARLIRTLSDLGEGKRSAINGINRAGGRP